MRPRAGRLRRRGDVTGVDWVDRRVNVNVTRDQVRSAPAFDPVAMADEVMQEQLHRHFRWSGFAA
jgi:hypothetical protein